MNTVIEQQIIEKAKRRLGFKVHFIIFLLLLPVNWIIWLLTDTTYIWPVWPTLGWGLGVLFHWLGVFHADKFLSLDKEVNRLMKRN